MAWTDEQIRNANTIASVGRKLGASRRDIVIALSAAIVESGLRNVHYGDRDSLGLFQQRAAWGSAADRTDPAKAARMFFLGGAAGQRGLFDIENRESMNPGAVAQAVQVSAFPGRYAEHLGEAKALLGMAPTVDIDFDDSLGRVPGLDTMSRTAYQRPADTGYTNFVDPDGELSADDAGIGEIGGLGGETPGIPDALGEITFDDAKPLQTTAPVDPSAGGGGGGGGGGYGGGGGGSYSIDYTDPMADTFMPDLADFGLGQDAKAGWRQNVVKAATGMLGTPYVWGGTSYSGVDCSGLLKLIFKQQGIDMPRISADQARTGTRVGLNQLEAGDLVAWDNSTRNNGADHIALYIGDGMIIEAPRPGSAVQLSKIYDQDRAWGVRLNFGQEAGMSVGAGAGAWGAQLNVAAAGQRLAKKFGVTNVGGYNDRNIAGSNKKSDHAFGLALDFMGEVGPKLDGLSKYAVENARELGVKYVIYNGHIWSAERSDQGWRMYDGANPHIDHVHVSFYGDSGANAGAGDAFAPRPGGKKTRDPFGADVSEFLPNGWDSRYPDGKGPASTPRSSSSSGSPGNDMAKGHPRTNVPLGGHPTTANKPKKKPRKPNRPDVHSRPEND